MLYYPVLAAIIQSISEFLPISSSAHLTIFSWLTGESVPLTHKIVLHVGSLLALIVYYGRFIWGCLKELWQLPTQSLAVKLMVLCLPAVIAGLLLNKYVACWHVPLVIGCASIVGGVLLIVSDLSSWKVKDLSGIHGPRISQRLSGATHSVGFRDDAMVTLTYPQVLIIGIFQIFALIPGMSRMGMILTGARFLGMDRVSATHLAFITAMPMIAGALVLNWHDIIPTWSILGVGALSLVMLSALLFCISRITYFWFGIYRILLGLVILFTHAVHPC